jgi:hypothetical protein
MFACGKGRTFPITKTAVGAISTYLYWIEAMPKTLKYAVVIEKGEAGYGAWVPDLPGCVATDKTEKRFAAGSPARSNCTSAACARMAIRSRRPTQLQLRSKLRPKPSLELPRVPARS